jgi:hypothetical protein
MKMLQRRLSRNDSRSSDAVKVLITGISALRSTGATTSWTLLHLPCLRDVPATQIQDRDMPVPPITGPRRDPLGRPELQR